MLFAVAADQVVRLGLHIPAQVLVLVTLAVYVMGFRVRTWWAWSVTGAGLFAFALACLVNYPPNGCDIRYFWLAGCDVVAGEDPYRNTFCLNPPTAMPLFGLLGLFPYPLVLAVWTGLNALGLVVLAVAAHALLARCPGAESWRLPAPMLGVVTAALVLSPAGQLGVTVGQMAFLINLAIVLAILGQQRGWPALSGLGLAIASVKTATMLPFLLLFLRWRDWRVWAWLAVVGCSLTFALTSPTELPGRVRECLANIKIQTEPGGLNQPGNPGSLDLIGIDRALHYLGVRDRSAAQWIHGAAIVVMLGWVAWRVRGPRALPDPAAWSLTAFCAMLFLYHRLYDIPILVIPLLYALGRARTEPGRCGWCYAACAGAVLGVLYFRYETVKLFCYNPPLDGWIGQLAGAAIIPYAVWLLVAGMLLLAAAERIRSRREANPEPSGFVAAGHPELHRLRIHDRIGAPPVLH